MMRLRKEIFQHLECYTTEKSSLNIESIEGKKGNSQKNI